MVSVSPGLAFRFFMAMLIDYDNVNTVVVQHNCTSRQPMVEILLTHVPTLSFRCGIARIKIMILSTIELTTSALPGN